MFQTLRNNTKIIVIIVVIAFIATSAFMGVGGLFGGGSNNGGNNRVGDSIARVNGEDISEAEYMTFLRSQASQTSDLSESQLIDFRLQVLDFIINRTLLLQVADEQNINIEVTEQDVQDEIDDIMDQYEITEEELIANIEQQGFSLDEFKQQLESDLKEDGKIRQIQEQTFSQVEVTEEEIQQRYEQNNEDKEASGEEFEEAKPDLKEQLLEEQRNQAFSNWLENQKNKAEIVIYDPVLRAANAFQSQEYEKTINELNNIISAEDSYPGVGVYIYLARAYQENGNTEKAIETYEEAKEEYPENWEVHLDLGELYQNTDNEEKALEELDKAADLVGDNYRAHVQLYQSYNALGAEEKAQKQMELLQELQMEMLQQQQQLQQDQQQDTEDTEESTTSDESSTDEDVEDVMENQVEIDDLNSDSEN